MAEHNHTSPDRDEPQARRDRSDEVGSSLGVQGEDPSFEAGSSGAAGADGGMGTEGAMMDDEDSNARTASATLSPTGGGVTGEGGGVENADFASSGGTREQNLGRSDQAGTGARPEGGVQQDRTQR